MAGEPSWMEKAVALQPLGMHGRDWHEGRDSVVVDLYQDVIEQAAFDWSWADKPAQGHMDIRYSIGPKRAFDASKATVSEWS